MKNGISKIFGLQAFWIRKVDVTEHSVEISVELKKKHCICPRCHRHAFCCHQKGKERHIKHHIWGNRTVYLKGRKKRWKCAYCGKPFTEVWPGLKDWSRKTEEADFQILNLLKGKSFRQLSEENMVTDREARYLLNKIDTTPNWDEEKRKKVIKLGIDEHSFRGRNLVVTITNLSTRRLKTILPDDKRKSLQEWIKAIPENIKPKIKEVCIDMKALFASVVKEELPKANLVVDHFHVIKDANHRLEEARSIEKDVHKKKSIGKRWWFLKGRERLKNEKKEQLDRVLEKYPVLKVYYDFKERLRKLYRSRNKEIATILLSKIISDMEKSHDAAINQWAGTLKRWRNYILNHFNRRTTNAFTEGTHTKIKMIKRLSFGFRNVQTYIRKMMLAFIPIALLGGLSWHTFC